MAAILKNEYSHTLTLINYYINLTTLLFVVLTPLILLLVALSQKKKVIPIGMAFLFWYGISDRTRTHLNAARTSAASGGSTELILYFRQR